jgi:hypothetical protein
LFLKQFLFEFLGRQTIENGAAVGDFRPGGATLPLSIKELAMSIMSQLAVAIQDRGIDLSADLDLPQHLTNIYACSVYRFDGSNPLHVNIAAAHTAVAVAKLGNWCVTNHGFRPYRASAKTPVRRLKMADLIQCPGVYDAALQLAKENQESDVVTALRKIPAWISQQTGVPLPVLNVADTDRLFQSLTNEIAALSA